MSVDPADLRYDERGLLPVVVQEVGSGAVLMLAFANREAIERTLASGFAHFWSRSRQSLWKKGETSGNTLRVVEVTADCDGDALLVRVDPDGPACHRGTRSCFEPNAAALELGWLASVLERRRTAPAAESYTARLFAAGVERLAQKVGEEGVEVALAAVSLKAAASESEAGARRSALAGEAADLAYHLLALLTASGIAPGEVAAELRRRNTLPPPAGGEDDAQEAVR